MKRLTFIAFFISSILLNGQVKFVGAGISAGGGSLSGNSPGTTAFYTSPFIDFNLSLMKDINLRTSFIYTRDINSIFPEDKSTRYYSYLQGFSLNVLTNQKVTPKLYLEESIGFLILNDRTFSDVDEWCIGTVFSAGINLRLFDESVNLNGFIIGLASEYGITFTNTLPSYISFYTQLKYSF